MIATFTFPADVEGYLWEHEGELLFEAARRVSREHVVVELGSYKGRSTICLAQGHDLVIAVDHFKGEQSIEPITQHFDHITGDYRAEFERNLDKYGVRANVLVTPYDTVTAAKIWASKTVGLLFVDAAHDYESVSQDLRAWLPLMAPEGYLILDDVNTPGVGRAMKELLGDWETIDTTQKMGILRRKQ